MGMAKCRKSRVIRYWPAFDRWLAQRSSAVRFIPGEAKQCPLAYFSNSDVHISSQKLRHEKHLRPLPMWAVMFVYDFDRRAPRTKNGQVTAHQTRKVLNDAIDHLVKHGMDLNAPSY